MPLQKELIRLNKPKGSKAGPELRVSFCSEIRLLMRYLPSQKIKRASHKFQWQLRDIGAKNGDEVEVLLY